MVEGMIRGTLFRQTKKKHTMCYYIELLHAHIFAKTVISFVVLTVFNSPKCRRQLMTD